MNSIKLISLLFTIAIAGSLTSCNKMDEKNSTATESMALKAISAKLGFTDYPTLEDGMMKFRDDDHYNKYITFLNQAVDGIDSTDTANDEHTVLLQIENGLHFTSLRKITHEAYERLDVIGWPSLEAIPDEHFILAADIRSTLNNNKEVMIGNEVIHYINATCLVKVLKDRHDLLEKYRNIPETESFARITMTDPQRIATTFIELKGEGRLFNRIGEKPTGGKADIYVYKSYPDLCENPGKVLFEQLSLLIPNDIGPATIPLAYFEIDFGDSSPIYEDISSQYDAAGFYYALPFYHPYPNVYPASYTMTIKGSTDSDFPPGDHTVIKTYQIDITGFQDCAIKYSESGWQYTNAGGNEYIGGYLDIDQYTPGKLRVVAYSKLVKETSPGVFQGFKGGIYSDLQGEAKKPGCTVAHQVNGSKWEGKTKKQTLHRTPDWQRWTEYSSNHVYIKNGQNYLKHIVLRPCN